MNGQELEQHKNDFTVTKQNNFMVLMYFFTFFYPHHTTRFEARIQKGINTRKCTVGASREVAWKIIMRNEMTGE